MRITREEAESELRWARELVAYITYMLEAEGATPQARASVIIERVCGDAHRLSAYTNPPKPLD